MRDQGQDNDDLFVRLDITEIERSRAANHYFRLELQYTKNYLQAELLKKFNTKFTVN